MSILLCARRRIVLPKEHIEYVKEQGMSRHRTAASDTRGAGRDDPYHQISGMMGEVILAYCAGIPKEYARDEGMASRAADFTCTQPHLEAKWYSRLQKKKYHEYAQGRLFVVIRPWDKSKNGRDGLWDGVYTIDRMAYGFEIKNQAPEWMCRLRGNAHENFEIPDAHDEAEIFIKNDAQIVGAKSNAA